LSGAIAYADRLDVMEVSGLSSGAGQQVAVLSTGVSQVPALAPLAPGFDVLAAELKTSAKTSPLAPTSTRSGPAKSGGSKSVAISDCDGQGTAMAGLIAAQSGVAQPLVGLAPHAAILPVKVVASADDVPTAAALATGISKAVTAGATVIVIASNSPGSADLAAAVQQALTAGVSIVAAGRGGSGTARSINSFPAAYPGVISVGIADSTEVADSTVASVTVSAPGQGLPVLALSSGYVLGQSGSAYAAALVAATVADLRSRYPALTPAQISDRLINTADRPATAVPSQNGGWGLINPVEALTRPFTASRVAPVAAAVAWTPPVPVKENSSAIPIALFILLLCGLMVLIIAGVRRAQQRRFAPADRRTQIGAPDRSV